ncbi:MAG: RNA polymerase sigma factor [Calditrichia bacterium]|nr:RNA polymerase sigma factor [Calditrichia bacterium]
MVDTEIVERIINNRAGSFKELVEEHQFKVINTCFRFVNNKEDAEDIAQEVFLEIHQSISKFRGDAKLSTWIYRIAVTKSLNFLRMKKRKKRMGHLKRIFGFEEEMDKLPSTNIDNPERSLEKKERLEILQKALDSIAENQRTAIILSKYDGYSYQEIAELMDTTISSVESLIHRAKKNLEKKLYNYFKKNL